ncbi:MAG: hypothetical protein APR54_10725 [Candidatus Cloacimonas sp. SDB]|nr:MAG: hypothetical protein APR54_10725 [Candidatus Cloacimonas sp. SDB]
MKLVATDLDRTLLNDDNLLSDRNLKTLKLLRKNGLITVIVTGRNLYSAHKVLDSDLPVDYLIFSSGSGIVDWKSKEIIYKRSLNPAEVEESVKILMRHQADFMIHQEIPRNHLFVYYQNGFYNQDFLNRIKLYNDQAGNWNDAVLKKPASQILAVIPKAEMNKFFGLRQELDFVKVIRTTSPLDHKTLWLEIFPENVSKGHTLKWLSRKLNIPRKNTCSLGNDYNDIDLLEWTRVSYLVANAPEELKRSYPQTLSNNEDGFSEWVEKVVLI